MSTDKDTISPAIRAALSKLPANNPAHRATKPHPAYRNPNYKVWTKRIDTLRGPQYIQCTDAPHGTLLESDENGATYALKF